jgi:hypothetical protein
MATLMECRYSKLTRCQVPLALAFDESQEMGEPSPLPESAIRTGQCRHACPLRSVESHVIPAKAGIHRPWVPACAGTTAVVSFIPLGEPQAQVHSVV